MFDRYSAKRFVAGYRRTLRGKEPIHWWRDRDGRIRKTDPAGDIHTPRTSDETGELLFSAARDKRSRKDAKRLALRAA